MFGVSEQDDFGVFTHAGDDGFYLMGRGVLGFVDNDEGVDEGSSPDVAEGLYFDDSAFDKRVTGFFSGGKDGFLFGFFSWFLGSEYLVDVVVVSGEPGDHFFFHVSGKEAHFGPHADHGARNDDFLISIVLAECLGETCGDSEVGFTGAGLCRAGDERYVGVEKRVEEITLPEIFGEYPNVAVDGGAGVFRDGLKQVVTLVAEEAEWFVFVECHETFVGWEGLTQVPLVVVVCVDFDVVDVRFGKHLCFVVFVVFHLDADGFGLEFQVDVLGDEDGGFGGVVPDVACGVENQVVRRGFRIGFHGLVFGGRVDVHFDDASLGEGGAFKWLGVCENFVQVPVRLAGEGPDAGFLGFDFVQFCDDCGEQDDGVFLKFVKTFGVVEDDVGIKDELFCRHGFGWLHGVWSVLRSFKG